MRRSRFHLRTRPRMYVVVFFTCGATVLLIEFLTGTTADFKSRADRQLQSAVSQAVESEDADLSREAP